MFVCFNVPGGDPKKPSCFEIPGLPLHHPYHGLKSLELKAPEADRTGHPDASEATATLYAVAHLHDTLDHLDESVRPAAEAFIRSGVDYLKKRMGDQVTISF